MPSIEEVNTFLFQVKSYLDANKYEILSRRTKYISTLAQLGIIEDDVIEDIKNLTVKENWNKKSDNNPNFHGDVYTM